MLNSISFSTPKIYYGNDGTYECADRSTFCGINEKTKNLGNTLAAPKVTGLKKLACIILRYAQGNPWFFFATAGLTLNAIHAVKNLQKNEETIESPKYFLSTGALGAGLCGHYALRKIYEKTRQIYLNRTAQKFIPTEELQEIEKAIPKAFTLTGMDKKGLKLVYFDRSCADKLFPPKIVEKILKKGSLKEIMEGKNACFNSVANTIFLPPQRNSEQQKAFFHELGHSMNFHDGKFARILQKLKWMPMLYIPIFTIALCKDKKASGEPPSGIFDKATDFVKNNVGKLTALCYLPVIAEEGLASIKGNKIAGQLLSPKMASKISKFNLLSLSWYAISGILLALSGIVAVKIKDAIAYRKTSGQKTV